MGENDMVILHYVKIRKNSASGVCVIVPQIMNSQASFAEVGFYNYGPESFDTDPSVVKIKNLQANDDYHGFPKPFNRPDLVVFHSPFDILKIAVLAKRLKKDGIPYVIVPHGCFSTFAMKKKWLKKRIARFVYMDRVVRDCTAMQYLSEGEELSSIYKNKSFIVPNGIFIPEYIEKKKNKLLEISFIGRKDVYHKGLDFLIEACGIAKSQLKDKVRINIYGPATDEQSARVRQLIKDHCVQDFVFDLPPVFGVDKKKVYMNTDVFVLTSRFEGQPVAILEAWSNGVPTLVTPGTNVAEECFKNDCGWSVSVDPKAIAEKLIDLTNNFDEIIKKSKNAYSYVKNTYSWENVATLYLTQYRKILNQNKN